MSLIPVIAFPEDTALPKLRRKSHPVIQYIKVLSRTTLLSTTLLLLAFKFLLQPALETTLQRRFALQNYVYQKLKTLRLRLKESVKNPPSVNVTYNGRNMVDRTVSTNDIIVEEARAYEYAHFKRETKLRSNINNGSSGPSKEVRFSNHTEGGSDQFSSFSDLNDRVSISSTRLEESLKKLKTRLEDLKVMEYKQPSTSGIVSGDPEMNSLFFQIKQLKNYLEVVTSEHPRDMLFKKPLSHIQVGRNMSSSPKFNYLDTLNDNMDSMMQVLDQ